MFAHYRLVLTGLLGVALLVIACGAMLRLGWRKGLVSLVPSVLSLGCGLAVLSLSGHAVNLFSLLALVLVLGIGVNYTLFFSNPRGTPLTSLLAITLAIVITSYSIHYTKLYESFFLLFFPGHRHWRKQERGKYAANQNNPVV